MPAMRISRYIAPVALAAFATLAHGQDSAKPTDDKTMAEPVTGPLAAEDAQLDTLFARLKKERSPESARALADRIGETIAVSGSATVDMLMANAAKAVSGKRYGAALDFVDQVTLLDPTYVEGWNRRATIHYLMGNFGKAMSDTARVLALEPRHLGALSGLAGILRQTGRNEQSLEAWQTYLSYYPADRDAQKEALELINQLSGQRT
jgi:tetratricopeptide (TPR) repeat protein